MSEQPTNPDPEDRFADPRPGQFANEPVNGADNEFDEFDNDRDDESAGDPGTVYEFPHRSGPRRKDGSVFDGPVIEGEIVEDPSASRVPRWRCGGPGRRPATARCGS